MKRFIIIGSVAFLLPLVVLAQSSRVVVDAEVGYSIEWNGNNGNHFNPETGAEAPENDGWEAAYAFASSNYFPNGIHDAVNVVDGYYGNSSSWIATPADADPWLALGWEEELLISRIAWSRDNGDSEGEGQLKDRAVGVYTLQFTRTADPDEETEETDDPGDGWVTFGSVEYKAGTENATFTSYLHHQFEIRQGNDPITATGFRVKVSNAGICIDEMEINGPPAESQSDFVDIQATEGFLVSWTQTNGDWFVEESPAPAHNNAALSSNGSVAFGSSELGLGTHLVSAVNDGFYSNAKSWIAAKTTGWVQIELPQDKRIDRIEWARDREGKYSDRLAVEYRIEVAMKVGEWTTVTSSNDRKPFSESGAAGPRYIFTGLPEAEAKRGRKLLASLKETEKQLETLKDSTKVYAGTFSQPGPTHRLYRGDPEAKREEVGPNAITQFVSLKLDRNTPEQKRRLALADWIVSHDNPLTTRVIVNRVWQHHFGTGLVDTPSDFGRNGVPPSHPEFLDWLASTFMSDRWSLKKLHRRILLSRVWQQSSRPNAKAMKIDATSRFLWRFPPRRLEAEGIRDSMLSVSGVLDLKMGGPGFSLFEIEKENVRHYFPKQKFGPADWRRMVYATKFRQELDDVFGAFDCPDGNQSVPRRGRSTTPMQALNLLNSAFVLDQADHLAARVKKDAGKNAEAQVRRAFHLTLGRAPEARELAAAKKLAATHGLPALARALFNTHEFITIP